MKILLECGGLRLLRRVSQDLVAQGDRKRVAGLFSAKGAFKVAGEGGGALIEFALVLPLMVMLITGMASFGLAISNYLILTSSVDSGARALSLARGQTIPALAASNPCAYAVQVANNSSPSLNPSSLTYSIAWTTINASGTSVTTNYSNASCAGLVLNAGDSVQVRAVYPFTIILYGWRPGALNMVSQTSELVQ